VRVAVLVSPPPDPLIVTVCVPSVADKEAVIVSVLVNVGYPLDGLNENDRPLLSDVALRLTVVMEPLTRLTVTDAVLLAPRHMSIDDGLTEIE